MQTLFIQTPTTTINFICATNKNQKAIIITNRIKVKNKH